VPALADGVVRNNMGVGGITVAVQGTISAGAVVVAITGQRLPVTGQVQLAADGWLWLAAQSWSHTEPVMFAASSGHRP
jgi:hypothetical protein